MEITTAKLLTSTQGAEALALASSFSDPDALSAAEAMRRNFPAELAAAALTQVGLRRRAQVKLGERGAAMLWTSDGVEQATRVRVSAWRAQKIAAVGVQVVIDLGCGAGADALAFTDAGLRVIAVELDAATAEIARFNVRNVDAEVVCGDGAELIDGLVADLLGTGLQPHQICVFLDPARRNAYGRSWRVEDMSPSWDFVAGQLASDYACWVKLGPGFPKELLPDNAQARWVSDGGDLVECSLWRSPSQSQTQAQRGAILLPDDIETIAGMTADDPPLGKAMRYIYEPNPAVSRSGALGSIVQWAVDHAMTAELPAMCRLAPGVAYLSADIAIDSPLAGVFEVLDVMDFQLSTLKSWVKAHDIGQLEIKKRAIDIDPAQLRRQLKVSTKKSVKKNSATFIIAPTINGAKCFVVQRIQ